MIVLRHFNPINFYHRPRYIFLKALKIFHIYYNIVMAILLPDL